MIRRCHALAKWAVEGKGGIYLRAVEAILNLDLPKLTLPLNYLHSIGVTLGQIVYAYSKADLLTARITLHNLYKPRHKVIGTTWVNLHIHIGIDIVRALE